MKTIASYANFTGIKQGSLMFLHQKLIWTQIGEEEYEATLEWSDTKGVIVKSVPVSNIDAENIPDRVLIAIDDTQKEDDTINFHMVSPECINDWKLIINSFLQRSSDDAYRYMELLWLLDKFNWNKNFLSKILSEYDIKYRSNILKCLQYISRCLSLNKQLQIKEVLGHFGNEYNVYHPDIIFSPIYESTDIQTDPDELNLFDAVDIIIAKETDPHIENPLLQSLYWLKHPEEALRDYSILTALYSYMSDITKSEIVKRYFHDIRNGHTELDIKILEQFKDNPHSSLSIYRYCISAPGEPIDLSIPLMCDCILTLIKSGGKYLQTFNGLMDLAISKCNRAFPLVDFKLDRLFPTCYGGAVINKSFSGFINYSILYAIDEKNLSEKKSLRKCAIAILDKYAKRLFYYACKPECCQKIVIQYRHNDIDTSKLVIDWKNLTKIYIDKWQICNKADDLVQKLVNGIITPENDVFDLDGADIHQLSKNIRDIVMNSLLPGKDDKTFFLKEKNIAKPFIIPFIVPEKIRITPYKDCRLGKAYGHIRARVDQSTCRELLPTEEQDIYTRITDSLESIFGVSGFNGEYFETDYDPALLAQLCSVYYYNKEGNSRQFLFDAHIPKYIKICAPKASPVCNLALSLPYFWCMGKECFKNALDKQNLNNEAVWYRYTAFHLFEIVGYPEIHETSAGFEPDETIRVFIALSNNVLRKFNSMRCRSCGHLLFPDNPGSVYQYNYFSCRNPYCLECGKSIYLNYCFQCKKGLIDSRDTRKCPNGWYICPKCLSCCNDQQYERMKQRYILQQLPVPQRVTENYSRGHNDKDIYFCPKCGNKLAIVKKNGYKMTLSCEFCTSTYNITILQ